MSRARRVSSSVWAFIDKVGWVIAIVFVGVGFLVVHNQGVELHRQGRALGQQVMESERNRHAQTRAQVDARLANCESGNRLRKGLRVNVINAERNLPLVLKLLPQLNTPEILTLNRASTRFQLKAFAPIDCKTYSEEVLLGHQHQVAKLDGHQLRRAGF